MILGRTEFLAKRIELKPDFEQFPDRRPKVSGSLGRAAPDDHVGTQFLAQARNSAPLFFNFGRSRVQDCTILRRYQTAISSLSTYSRFWCPWAGSLRRNSS